jgi:hypothetical protein
MSEADVRLRYSPRIEREGLADRVGPRLYENDDFLDLTPFIATIRARWLTIAGWALLATFITGIFTGLLLPKWYRAEAVIRPISTPAVESRIAGALGGLGGGFGGLGGLAASIGVGGSNDAEEYVAILRGFQFNVNLAENHHLAHELLQPGFFTAWFGSLRQDPHWEIYRTLQKRFDCEYSVKTGNITIYFQARNRRDAEEILSYYIDDLHDLLRAREVKSASSAIQSLEDEARATPDAVLRAVLYDLVAKQLQRKKMAEVEADFAFRVLDAPAASDRAYRPRMMLDCVLAAFLAACAAACLIFVRGPQPRTAIIRSEALGRGRSVRRDEAIE